MTELRFRITPGAIPGPLLEKAYFASWGRSPRPTQISFNGDEMVVRASAKGSGSLHVLWPHHQLGLVMEATDSLLGRSRPYLLMKELGRGALSRILRKLFEWQSVGFRMSPELSIGLTEISRRFSKAAVADAADPDVQRAFTVILEDLDRFSLEATHFFSEQAIAWRMRGTGPLPILLGVGMNTHPIGSLYEFDLYSKFLQEAFHAVLPMPSWRDLEPEPDCFQWELLERRLAIPSRFGFQIVMGPLLSFEQSAFPSWLSSRFDEDGFFESRATRFVNAVTERYGHTTDLWILSSRFNSATIPDISIGRSITLLRMLAQQIRSRGIVTPILVGIDRPWGEYGLARIPEFDLVQIAEALMGCSEIDAFLLEMNFGLDSRSTFPRDPMAIGNMIDQWSYLGKKIYVSLSVPSSPGDDPSDPDKILSPELQWSEGIQRFWTEMLMRTLMGKRMVQGVFWTPLQDGDENPEDTKSLDPFAPPYAGLIDSSRVLKLSFKQLVALRQAMIK